MLIKTSLYLSNCDSVRRLDIKNLEIRIYLGILLSKSIILSPNILIDTHIDITTFRKIERYLKNENDVNSITIRGKDMSKIQSLYDYVNTVLNENFRFSSFNGKELKELSKSELSYVLQKARQLDKFLHECNVNYESISIKEDSLSNKIKERLESYYKGYFGSYEEFKSYINTYACSRSEWYAHTESFFRYNKDKINKIFSEVIDPAYNSLFIKKSEAFVYDRIKVIEPVLSHIGLSSKILEHMIQMKSFKDKISLALKIIKFTEFIYSLGQGEVLKFFMDEIEDFIQDKGIEIVSRRNWFGMYPIILKKLGVEIL